MEVKKQSGTEVRLGIVNNHDLAAALNRLVPTEDKDEGYVIDPNSVTVAAAGSVDRLEVKLHRPTPTDRSHEPTASDAQRMKAGIPPRLTDDQV